jgi:hypothetical protein
MKKRLRLDGGVAQTSAFVVTMLFWLKSTNPFKCESALCCVGHFGGLLYKVAVGDG